MQPNQHQSAFGKITIKVRVEEYFSTQWLPIGKCHNDEKCIGEVLFPSLMP